VSIQILRFLNDVATVSFDLRSRGNVKKWGSLTNQREDTDVAQSNRHDTQN